MEVPEHANAGQRSEKTATLYFTSRYSEKRTLPIMNNPDRMAVASGGLAFLHGELLPALNSR
jgi:hypothetical protein